MSNAVMVPLLLVALASPPPSQTAPEEAAIRQCYEEYRTAALAGNGAQAARLVDRATLDHFDGLRKLALSGSAEKVRSLGLLDKIVVLRLRLESTAADLKAQSGASLFAAGIEKGQISREGVASGQLGALKIEGSRASGALQVGTQSQPGVFGFTKEDGRWRLDMTVTLGVGEVGLKRVQEQSGLDPDAFVFAVLEQVVSKKLEAKVWQPLVPE